MSATPQVHTASDLDLPSFETQEARMSAVHECDHDADDVALIEGPPSVSMASICTACGDLL